MQLRVARLCLDCEELHVDNRCPRCVSERYAFVTNWLPSEERRRWKRPQVTSSTNLEKGLNGIAHSITRWFRGEPALKQPAGPATRRSDLVAHMNFDESTEENPKETAHSIARPASR